MKTIEKRLTESGQRIRGEVVRHGAPTVRTLHRRQTRRRTTMSLSMIVLVAAVVGATALMTRTPEEPASPAFRLPEFIAYERAAENVVSCMRDAGYVMEGPFRYPEGGLAYGLGGPTGPDPRMHLSMNRLVVEGESQALADRTWAECESSADYREREQVWFKAYEPYLLPWGVWVDNLLECLAGRGATIPEWVDQEILREEFPGGTMNWNDSHHWLSNRIGLALVRDGCTPWEG